MYRSCPQRANQGVALIEVIMVIVLLSAAAVASSILLDGQWLARRSVTSVTAEVAETINAARNTAITNQAVIRIRRQRRSGVESLLVVQEPGPFGPGRTRTVELGDGIRLRGSPREIRFDPSGSANRSLRWTVSSSRSSGQVSVSPADGQVSKVAP